MILLQNPSDYFVAIVEPLPARETTKAYVAGVFLEAAKNCIEAEYGSIVLSYACAVEDGRFEKFQSLGDWILWSLSFVPEYHSGFEELVFDFGRRSYESCWRILRGNWDLYAELADNLPTIVYDVRERVK